MFNLETFNDLISRRLLQEDTLIQTKKGIKSTQISDFDTAKLKKY